MQAFGGFEMARDENAGHNREHAFATFLHEGIFSDSCFIRHKEFKGNSGVLYPARSSTYRQGGPRPSFFR
jgi:hypothetical protein